MYSIDTERFKSLVDKNGSCWLWLGSVKDSGYGTYATKNPARPEKRTWRAHRLAYLVYLGIDPADLDCHHVCGEKLCVNPSHIALVTREEHMEIHPPVPPTRMSCRLYCFRGHSLMGDKNVYRERRRRGDIRRRCRLCCQQRKRAWRKRRRAAGLPRD